MHGSGQGASLTGSSFTGSARSVKARDRFTTIVGAWWFGGGQEEEDGAGYLEDKVAQHWQHSPLDVCVSVHLSAKLWL